MKATVSAVALAALIAVPTVVVAQQTPPAGSLPLSQVVSRLETSLGGDLSYISDVSWDDDGYWEVEYQTTDNREVEIRVDPASGEIRQR